MLALPVTRSTFFKHTSRRLSCCSKATEQEAPIRSKLWRTLKPLGYNCGSVRTKENTMEWTTPKFEEVCLNCEINSYANAEL